MKRLSIRVLFILFFINFTLQASDGLDKLYTFVGIQSGYAKYDNIDAPTIGIKYGKQNSQWRTALIYNYAINSDDIFQSVIMQVDRGVLTEMFRDYPIKMYMGFSLGVMQYKNDYIRDRGYVFGGNIGFNYVLNNEIDIDLGYRYMTTSKFKDIDDRGDVALSLHYYFD